MFGFAGRSGMRRPSGRIRRALETHDLPDGTAIANLGVVERPGHYAGHEVTLLRVFDPKRAVRRGVEIYRSYAYDDLNAHPDLVMAAGHTEPDGTVVLDEPRHGSVRPRSRSVSARSMEERHGG